jgi:hypothetical protein
MYRIWTTRDDPFSIPRTDMVAQFVDIYDCIDFAQNKTGATGAGRYENLYIQWMDGSTSLYQRGRLTAQW